jgi:hypothetical protein
MLPENRTNEPFYSIAEHIYLANLSGNVLLAYNTNINRDK